MFVIQPQELSHGGTDGRAGQHDRRLGPHGAAETDRGGAGEERGVTVMRLDARFFARYGVKNTRHSVRDVVLDPIGDEQHGDGYPDHRVKEVEDVGRFDVGPRGQPLLDQVDAAAQQMPGDAGGHADHHGQDHDELPFGEAFGEPREPAV